MPEPEVVKQKMLSFALGCIFGASLTASAFLLSL